MPYIVVQYYGPNYLNAEVGNPRPASCLHSSNNNNNSNNIPAIVAVLNESVIRGQPTC